MIKKIKFILVLNILLCFNQHTFAQEANGAHPPSTKWKYTENTRVKVIFPEGSDTIALRIANMIDYVGSNKSISVGSKYKKLELLLNTNTVISNGYVALAPFRSEFYGTSFQNFNFLGSLNWLDALSIHEYRHAQQFANAKRGVTKWSYLLSGQLGWNLAANISIPSWYFEGDAVYTETILTSAGRGRTPSFFELQRALALDNINYSYLQTINGSYKKLLPNRYPIGYSIIHYGHNHFDEKMWSKVLADAGSYKYIIYPFSRALKHHTGLTTKEMYELANEELKSDWEKELQTIELTPSKVITNIPKETVTDYSFPHVMNDGSILAIKSSFKDLPALYKIKDGKEEYLTSIGINNEDFLNVNNNLVSWTELRKDVRYSNRTYSVVMVYDLYTHKKTQISKKSKLFSPVFSRKGDKFLAVQADEKLQNKLLILSSDGKTVIDSVANTENDFLAYPNWAEEENAVIYLAKRNSKIAMLKYDLSSKKITELTPWSSHTIGNLSVYNNTVIFSASYSGINNIYEVPIDGSKNITQLSSVKIGASNPSVSLDGKTIVMAQTTPMGDQLISIDKVEGKSIIIKEPVDMERYNVNTTEIEHNILDENFDAKKNTVKNYNGFFKGVKLHSWAIDIDERNIGFNLMMDNILNDFSAVAGLQRNYNEKTVRFKGGFEYAKFFLPISMSVNSGNRRNDLLAPDKISTFQKKFVQNDVNIGVSLPLSWVTGNYTTGLKVKASFSNISTNSYEIDNIPVNNSLNLNVLKFGLDFTNTRRKALQNVNNKWSQSFNIYYENSISAITAERILGNVSFTIPGIRKNHVMEFNFRGKKELMKNDYLFEDYFFHARGYSPVPSDIETVYSANYGLPLFNVDKGFAGILFINRVRANAFYDVGTIKRYSTNSIINQQSIGAEIIFDVNLLNQIGIGLGIRNSIKLNDNNKYNPEMFIAIKL